MSKEIKEFEELLQTNEVYRDVLGKWGTEITRNIIKKLLASQREKVVEEIIKKGREMMMDREELELAKQLDWSPDTNLDGFLNVLENELYPNGKSK